MAADPPDDQVFFFAAVFFLGAVFFLTAVVLGFAAGVSAETFFANPVFFAHRPVRTGAAAMSAWHSSSVSDAGSRSFGILPFFLPSVMYGP